MTRTKKWGLLTAALALVLATVASQTLPSAFAGGEGPPPPPSKLIAVRPVFKAYSSGSIGEVHLPANLPSDFHFNLEHNVDFKCSGIDKKTTIHYEIRMFKETTGYYLNDFDIIFLQRGTANVIGGPAYIEGLTTHFWGGGQTIPVGKLVKHNVAPAVKNLGGRVMFEQRRDYLNPGGCKFETTLQIMPPGK